MPEDTMPERQPMWYEKKRNLLPLIFFLPIIGTGFLWATPWPRKQKLYLTAAAAMCFLVIRPALYQGLIGNRMEPEPTPTAQVDAPTPEPEPESPAEPAAEAEPAAPSSIIRPEHQDKPTYINPVTSNDYMVVTEPIGNSGQLQMARVSLEDNSTSPVVANCADFQQRGNGAAIQVGQPDGTQATIEDYSDWFSTAIASFCDDWTATAEATPPPPVAAPTVVSMPETQAMLISEDVSSRINVRTGPSTATDAPAYGFAGDPVTMLARSVDDDNYTWYRVRFNVSRHVGWVREDFVTTNIRPVRSEPAPAPAPAPQTTTRAPVRNPVSGSCDCPYDLMSNGRECRGNSAYSQPGGRNPICYTTDRP